MIMNGRLQVKTLSGSTHSSALTKILEILLLLGAGMIAILLHARFKTPYNIPGHHGIEFMAIFVLARMSSNMKFAGTISAIGIGSLLLFNVFGFTNPLMGFYYMVPGITLDILYNAFKRLNSKFYLLALFSGLAYMTIPLVKTLFFLSTGYPYPSLIKHAYYIVPFIGFLVFGMLGGLAGYTIFKGITIAGKKRNKIYKSVLK